MAVKILEVKKAARQHDLSARNMKVMQIGANGGKIIGLRY